jgi:hypothetical protein
MNQDVRLLGNFIDNFEENLFQIKSNLTVEEWSVLADHLSAVEIDTSDDREGVFIVDAVKVCGAIEQIPFLANLLNLTRNADLRASSVERRYELNSDGQIKADNQEQILRLRNKTIYFLELVKTIEKEIKHNENN